MSPSLNSLTDFNAFRTEMQVSNFMRQFLVPFIHLNSTQFILYNISFKPFKISVY